MSQFFWQGIDLDTLYEARVGSIGSLVNYTDLGWNLSDKYSKHEMATAADGNLGSRIPNLGTYFNQGFDFSALFVGNPAQYTVSSLANPSDASPLVFSTPTTLTHEFTVTFPDALALNDYFEYGGRIIISATNTGGIGGYDSDLTTAFSNMGNFVVWADGVYRTGTAGTVEPAPGGRNFGTTPTLLFQMPIDGGLYGGLSTYEIWVTANNTAGNASSLTFTIDLNLIPNGEDMEYNGIRTSVIQQRNYTGTVPPVQSAPTYSLIQFNW